MDKMSLWGYGEGGAWLSGLLASLGLAFNAFVGGWDNMIDFLLWAMAIDFITGLVASFKNQTTDSHVMFWGGVNKVMVFVLVGLAFKVDLLLGNTQPIIRTAVIWFYIGRELLSLIENYGKMGMKLPPVLKNALAQIIDKGGHEDGNGTKTDTTTE